MQHVCHYTALAAISTAAQRVCGTVRRAFSLPSYSSSLPPVVTATCWLWPQRCPFRRRRSTTPQPVARLRVSCQPLTLHTPEIVCARHCVCCVIHPHASGYTAAARRVACKRQRPSSGSSSCSPSSSRRILLVSHCCSATSDCSRSLTPRQQGTTPAGVQLPDAAHSVSCWSTPFRGPLQ